jgi:hypothetical protein
VTAIRQELEHLQICIAVFPLTVDPWPDMRGHGHLARYDHSINLFAHQWWPRGNHLGLYRYLAVFHCSRGKHGGDGIYCTFFGGPISL